MSSDVSRAQVTKLPRKNRAWRFAQRLSSRSRLSVVCAEYTFFQAGKSLLCLKFSVLLGCNAGEIMPEKYHIKTQPVPPRRPRIGKHGVVDWREDCARCHNCVKKACVYDRYRQESDYIRQRLDVDALFFDCMVCFSCV